MENDKALISSIPPSTLPLPPDVWVARRFGLPDATARVVAELAWPTAKTSIGGAY